MINGHVDVNLQPKVPLALIDGIGQASAIEAVVDTGFNGYLCVSVLEIDYTNQTVRISNSRRKEG